MVKRDSTYLVFICKPRIRLSGEGYLSLSYHFSCFQQQAAKPEKETRFQALFMSL